MKKLITILLLGFFLTGCTITDFIDEHKASEVDQIAYEAIIKECVDELKECRADRDL